MNETKELVESIVEGIQDKKGRKIRIADLTGIEDTICKYLVICEGNSPNQVNAIYESVWDVVHKQTLQKPTSVDGLRNSLWIAMDYSDVVVHVFVPEMRSFYDIDHLWEDSDITDIEDDF